MQITGYRRPYLIKYKVNFNSSPAGVRIIAISMPVCLSVRSHNSEPARLYTSPNFCACCLMPRGSVLLWRPCDTLCRPTSVFTDDVMFSYRWTNGRTASNKIRLQGRGQIYKNISRLSCDNARITCFTCKIVWSSDKIQITLQFWVFLREIFSIL